MEKKKDLDEVYEKLFDENNRNYFTYVKFLKDSGFSDSSEKTVNKIFNYFNNKNYFDGIDFLICCIENSEEEGAILYAINTKDEPTFNFIKDTSILISSIDEITEDTDIDSRIYDAIIFFNDFGLLESKYELIVENEFILDILFSKLKKENKKILLLNEEMIEECNFIDLPAIIENADNGDEDNLEYFTNTNIDGMRRVLRDLTTINTTNNNLRGEENGSNLINVTNSDRNSILENYEEYIKRMLNM